MNQCIRTHHALFAPLERKTLRLEPGVACASLASTAEPTARHVVTAPAVGHPTLALPRLRTAMLLSAQPGSG